jgi:hypothetical protein
MPRHLPLHPVLTSACQKSNNIFDNLPMLTSTAPIEKDELDRYLSTETEPIVDALHWWVEKQGVYPRLARMACDFLSIPGQSVATSSSCR